MPPLHLSAARKNKRGVSPIIATILLVAITVVIAAVLYVLVSGYLKGTGTAPLSVNLQNPANGKCTKANTPVTGCSGTNAYIVFSSVSASKGVTTSELGFKIIAPSGASVSFTNCVVTYNGVGIAVFNPGSGWDNSSVPVNASENIVFESPTSLVGSGDDIQAVGLSGASVSGGYSGL